MSNGTWMVALGGIFGALGVASAAAASHNDTTGLLAPASAMLLAHAPVMIALYAARTHLAFVGAAAAILSFGTIMFTGDLAVAYANVKGAMPAGLFADGLFPMAAPIGGVLMIAGWLVIIVCAFFPKKP